MVATAVATVPSSPVSGGTCGSEIYLDTLHIEAAPSKKRVSRGERFVVEMTVTRPAHKDPVDQGIEFEPPVSIPAADIPVGITIFVGKWSYFWGFGLMDENGKADVPMKVPGNFEVGWSLAVATAKKYQTQACPEVVEEGLVQFVDFVKVVP